METDLLSPMFIAVDVGAEVEIGLDYVFAKEAEDVLLNFSGESVPSRHRYSCFSGVERIDSNVSRWCACDVINRRSVFFALSIIVARACDVVQYLMKSLCRSGCVKKHFVPRVVKLLNAGKARCPKSDHAF